MIPTALTEPAPGGVCRVCEHALPDGSLRCAHCGAVYGESQRCPHCRAVTDVGANGRCRVCGAPRIAADDALTVRTGRELPLLVRARRAQLSTPLYWLGAGVAAAMTAVVVLALGTAAALTNLPFVASAIGFVFAALPAVLAVLLARRARAQRGAVRKGMEQARLLVASDVLRSHGGRIQASELGRILRISEHDAELVLAELSLADFAHAHVTETGDLDFAPGRLRVTEGFDAPTTEVELPAELREDGQVAPPGTHRMRPR